MIKISVLYADDGGRRFDMDYYCNKHVPMVRQKLGNECRGVAVEQGISGISAGSRPAYVAMGHLFFDSLEAFHAVFSPHRDAIVADVPNYTNIQPAVQISEVKI
jgi:uncharacterized protein (TIGR02118 family)